MARAVVVVGTPVDLEPREFEKKDGSKARSLGFKLNHQATALGGAVPCETRDELVWKLVEEAHESGSQIMCVAVPYCVRYDKDGENRDFTKLTVRAVLTD